MEEFILRLIFYFLLFAAAGAIGHFIRKKRAETDMREMPDKDTRYRLLEELRAKRMQGATHSDCMNFLQSQGLRKGVAQSLIMDVELEEPADIDNPKTITWNNYTCKYPGNWKVKPLFEDKDNDLGITIEGPGSGMLMLLKEVEDSSYTDFISNLTSEIKDLYSTSISEWGKVNGEGLKYSGVHKQTKIPVEFTVFKPSTAKPRYIVAEYYANEEEKLVIPALELMRSTFHSDN